MPPGDLRGIGNRAVPRNPAYWTRPRRHLSRSPETAFEEVSRILWAARLKLPHNEDFWPASLGILAHNFRVDRYPGTNRGWFHFFARRSVQMPTGVATDEQPPRPGNLEVSRLHKALLLDIRNNRQFLDRANLCAQHLGATGLTFFDDEVIEVFSPHAKGKSTIFLLAIGR